VSACVLVADERHPAGGFETWVETLATGLPRVGVATLLLWVSRPGVPCPPRLRTASRVVPVPLHDDAVEQARALLGALEQLAVEGLRGVFFAGGYAAVDIASINLLASPWVRVPVAHGSHPSAHDWICLGPPVRAIAPSRELAVQLRRQMRMRIGRVRALRRVTCIPHGVTVPPATLRVPRGTDEAVRIAAVSRLHPDQKRPLDYVRIAVELQRRGIAFAMTIVGDGPARAEMEQMCAVAALGSQVRFTGTLAPAGVTSVLSQSDVFLLVSESEAFGLAAAEALAAGCAVVASAIGGEVAQMVSRTGGMLVPCGDIPGFADAIAALESDRSRTAAIGAAGPRVIERDYSQRVMLERYARLVKTLSQRVQPQPLWRAPELLAQNPGQAVGPGLRRRIRDAAASAVRGIWRVPGRGHS
jgi:glycosyltransferase involved in cell wall biosynthesis